MKTDPAFLRYNRGHEDSLHRGRRRRYPRRRRDRPDRHRLLRNPAQGAGARDHGQLHGRADPRPVGAIQSYYEQEIAWGACAEGTFDSFQGVNSSDASEYQCAFLKAPLDWSNPDGDQITLALAIHRSGVEGAPALFVNPGGPGGAVVSALPYYAAQGIGEAVVKAYDIVALDPRGVGDSTPVFCMTDAEKDERNAGEEEGTADESPQSAVAEAQEDSRTVAAGCREHSGSLFEYIDTVSAARDFDMVRAVLGQEP